MEEVTNAMYDKTLKFAMTHDIQLKLPQMMFDGSILRISPRSFEGNGALVHIELQPDTRSLQERHGSPRFILKKISKSRRGWVHTRVTAIPKRRCTSGPPINQ